MGKRIRHIARLAALPIMFAGAVGCAPSFDRSVPVDIRPVASTARDNFASDDNAYQFAATAIGNRDYGLALDYLQAARQKKPDDVRVLNGFGVVYDKLGRFDLSARYYAQALALEPGSRIVLGNMAYSETLKRLTQHDGALPKLADNAAARSPGGGTVTVGSDHALPLNVKDAPAMDASVPVRVEASRRAEPGVPAGQVSRAPADTTLATPASAPAPVEEPTPLVAQDQHPVRSADPGPTAPNTTRPPGAKEEAVSPVAAATVADRSAEPRVEMKPAPARQIAPMPAAPAESTISNAPNASHTASAQLLPAAPATRDALAPAPARSPLRSARPLAIVNASGRTGVADRIRRRLAGLGWTAPRSAVWDASIRRHTALYYAPQHSVVAHSLARSLRFSVHLVARSCGCGGLELIVGEDMLSRIMLTDNIDIDDDVIGAPESAAHARVTEIAHGPT